MTGFSKTASHLVMAVLPIIAVCHTLDYRYNITPSMPCGIYRVSTAAIKKGSLVSYCLSDPEYIRLARDRQYLPPSGSCQSGLSPLLKIVAALPGDMIGIAGGITVNHVAIPNTAAKDTDSHGRLMPPPRLLPGVVPDGQALLLSDSHPGGFDSRYFGLVPLDQLQPVEAVLIF